MSVHNPRALRTIDDIQPEFADLLISIPGDTKIYDMVRQADELLDKATDFQKARVEEALAVYVKSVKAAGKKGLVMDPWTRRLCDFLLARKAKDFTKKPDIKLAAEAVERELTLIENEYREYLGLTKNEVLPKTLHAKHKTAMDHYLALNGKAPEVENDANIDYLTAVHSQFIRLEPHLEGTDKARLNALVEGIYDIYGEIHRHSVSYRRRGHTHEALSGHTSKKVTDLVGAHLDKAATTRKAHEQKAEELKKEHKRHTDILAGDRKFGDALGKTADDIKKMLGVMTKRGSVVDADAITARVDKLKDDRKVDVQKLTERRASILKQKRAQSNKDLGAAYGLLFNYGPVQKSASVNKLYEALLGNLDVFGKFPADLHACLVAKRETGKCEKEWDTLVGKIMKLYRSDVSIREAHDGAKDIDEAKARHFEDSLAPFGKIIEEWDSKDAVLLRVSYVSIEALLGKTIDKKMLDRLQEEDASGEFRSAPLALEGLLNKYTPCTTEVRLGDGTVMRIESDAFFTQLDDSTKEKIKKAGVFGLKLRETKSVAQLLDDLDDTMAIQLDTKACLRAPAPAGVEKVYVRGRKDANVDIVYQDAKGYILKVDENINTDAENGPEMAYVLSNMNINAELLRVTKDKKGWGGRYIETSPLAA